MNKHQISLKNQYPQPLEHILWPCRYRSYGRTAITRIVRSLFDRMNWSLVWSPSWIESFRKLGANIILCLTPWYRTRGKLREAWVNSNGGKLLWSCRTGAGLRTRRENIVYYDLVFTFFRAKMQERVLLDEKGKHQSAFLVSLGLALGQNNEGVEKKYRWTKRTVATGWCATREQCESFLDCCVSASPDLDWVTDAKYDQIMREFEEEEKREEAVQ